MDRQVKGILGAKLGMTQVWDNNKVVPVTVVQAGPCVVTQVRTPDKDGYSAVQLGVRRDRPAQGEQADDRPLHQGRRGAATPPRRDAHRRRQRVHARPGGHGRCVRGRAAVDVTGTTKGKGFAGVMKRHGFHGLGAGHGVAAQAPLARLDRRLRHAGSRLQGHPDGRPDGRRPHTTQSLTIQAVDAEQNVILVRGAIPGPKGALVLIRDGREGAKRRPGWPGDHG